MSPANPASSNMADASGQTRIGIDEAGSAMAQSIAIGRAIRAAAAQHQQQQQQDREKQAATELEIRGKGGVPYEPVVEQTPPGDGGKPVMSRAVPNPDPAYKDNPQPYTDAWGRRWLLPDVAGEKKAAAQHQTLVDTMNALKDGVPAGPTPVPESGDGRPTLMGRGNNPGGAAWSEQPVLDPRQNVTVPGSGQVFNVRNQDEVRQMRLRDHLTELQQTNDSEGWVPPDSLADNLARQAGLPEGSLRGVRIPKEAVGGAFTRATSADKTEKTATPHITTSTDDAGNVTITRTDPDSGKEMWTRTVKGVGVKRKDPDAAPATKPPSAAQLRMVTVKKNDGLAKAQQAYGKEIELVGGKQATPQDRQAAADNLLRAKQATQDEYEQSISALVGKPVDHFDYASQGATPAKQSAAAAASPVTQEAQPQPTAKPAAPQASDGGRGGRGAPAAPKSAAMADVRTYAQRKGVSVPAAVREFKALGYQIGQ